ncbi:macro domain-containing protein [Nocardia altamirensis]|uniref:macro domain-containing protein n=1 Tax=Nocardia altamirensis TaxID=472158 RepID=UPI00083FFC26|nr:macro domain-containing protein [Nocardia altamirensis]
MQQNTIRYVTGDATQPHTSSTAIIAHICNNIGAWGAGFVLAVSSRWPEPEREYQRWYHTGAAKDFGLGAVQLVQVSEQLHVANMVAQHGIRSSPGDIPIRYDALDQCLSTLAEHALNLHASIHMPRIGTGLAGGDWMKIEPLILERLCRKIIPVTVYEFP